MPYGTIFKMPDGRWHDRPCKELVWENVVEERRHGTGATEPFPRKEDLCRTCFGFLYAAEAKTRLEYLREELNAERISYGEIAELQDLVEYIDPGDVQLLEAAGVPEFPDDEADEEAETPEPEVLKHKGHRGSVALDPIGGSHKSEMWHGKILDSQDLVTYDAETRQALDKSFREAVDDYLETLRFVGRCVPTNSPS